MVVWFFCLEASFCECLNSCLSSTLLLSTVVRHWAMFHLQVISFLTLPMQLQSQSMFIVAVLISSFYLLSDSMSCFDVWIGWVAAGESPLNCIGKGFSTQPSGADAPPPMCGTWWGLEIDDLGILGHEWRTTCPGPSSCGSCLKSFINIESIGDGWVP